MKKFFTSIMVFLLVAGSLFASPVRFVFGDVGQHPEILMGFCPSYVLLGAGFGGELLEGSDTELQLLIGAGYNQRKVWQDPITSRVFKPGVEKGITYDVIQTDYMVRFNQGFLNDSLKLRLGLEMKYEENKDSFKSDKNAPLPLIEKEVYPDLAGDKRMFGSALALRLTYDIMDDDLVHNDGFKCYFDAVWAPKAMNALLDGNADYYSLTFNAVGAKTLYVFNSGDKDWFSVVLADRVNVNWTDGDMIPVYAQGPVSLGRKVRGYNTYTYNTQFTVVNNLDIRLAGPGLGIGGIRPRFNFFLDVGYGCGEYFNTLIGEKGDNFLASTGAQFTVSFFDFIDLGYQVAYLFTGDKFTSPGKDFVTTFTFFLDF